VASRRSGLLGAAQRSTSFAVVAPLPLGIVARDRLADLLRDSRRQIRSVRAIGAWPRPQRPQADQLGQFRHRFEGSTAAGAEIAEVIGRRPFAPHACSARQALGMRHGLPFRRARGNRFRGFSPVRVRVVDVSGPGQRRHWVGKTTTAGRTQVSAPELVVLWWEGPPCQSKHSAVASSRSSPSVASRMT
jgi:hypothetical protein